MQYLDGTAAGLGINPFDPAQAIDAAAQQFAERLAKGYSPEEAVQAHFAGTTARCGRIKPSVIGKRFWSGRRRSSASICSGRRPPKPAVPATPQLEAEAESDGLFSRLGRQARRVKRAWAARILGLAAAWPRRKLTWGDERG